MEFEYSDTGICSICAGPLRLEDPTACPRCKVRYHSECWSYNYSRCAVYGCADGGQPRLEELPRTALGSAGTLLHCAFHPANERVLDCRACGRSICSLCDIRVRAGRRVGHYCPSCFEQLL